VVVEGSIPIAANGIYCTIHSFDPCMACAVHLIDTQGRELTRVETF
jgi:Ni,Fe-hydrogenase I large subunit